MLNRLTNRDSVNVLFGDSLQDVADFLHNTPQRWPRAAHDAERTMPSQGWDLAAGYAGAWRMARDGWSAGALDLADRLAVAPPVRASIAHWKMDVAGELPDVGRYVAGEPAHMRQHKRVKGQERAVHLVINMIASAAISAEEFRNYGAAIAGMIDRIESSGRRCEVDLLYCNATKGKRSLCGWKIKRAEDAPDLAALAFSIAHPAAFRRIGFAMFERLPTAQYTPGYGRCGDLTADDAAQIDAQDALLINGIQHRPGACRTLEGALALAAEQINKAAGETLVEVEQ